MAKVAVIGRYENRGLADGQTIKTQIFVNEMEAHYGKENITRLNTNGWKKHPLDLIWKCVTAVWNHPHVIFMTDAGGIKVLPTLLLLANLFTLGRTKIHYVVIGGWLPQSLETRKLRAWLLKKLDGVYVETQTMKSALEQHGLRNVSIVRNCKPLSILSEADLVYPAGEPYRLCTFSRIMREKGIPEAVDAVRTINEQAGRVVCTLDIYGQVDEEQVDWFDQLKATFPDYIRFGGLVPFGESVEVLKQYFALLFPTKLYYVEGVPGTIIDAYTAGLPVIASRWASSADVLHDETCLSYDMSDEGGLQRILQQVLANPELLNSRKKNCLQHAQMYTPEVVMQTLYEKLNIR